MISFTDFYGHTHSEDAAQKYGNTKTFSGKNSSYAFVLEIMPYAACQS